MQSVHSKMLCFTLWGVVSVSRQAMFDHKKQFHAPDKVRLKKALWIDERRYDSSPEC